MIEDKTTFAIIGCGSIGKRHVAVLDKEEKAEIIAICDIDKEKAKNLSKLYDNIPYYTNYKKMLREINADIINVVTPHKSHCSISIDICNAGMNVLVEKPMALSIEDCKNMNLAAQNNNVKLWVVKQNRFNVPVQLTNNAITKKMLGRIFMVKCDVLWNRYQGYYDNSPWRGKLNEEGGALFTQVSHFIDLLIWWCGDICDASGIMETQNHKIDTEDSASAIVKFNNGAIGSINWTTNVYNKNYEGSITIIGENGTIKIGGRYLNKIEYWDVNGYPLDENIEFTDKPNAYGKYQGTSSNHDKVIKAIISDLTKDDVCAEVVDGFEGSKSVAFIEKVYNALKVSKK